MVVDARRDLIEVRQGGKLGLFRFGRRDASETAAMNAGSLEAGLHPLASLELDWLGGMVQFFGRSSY